MKEISYRKITSQDNNLKYAFRSTETDIEGVPLYEYVYLGNEIDAFTISYRGNLIAQVKLEKDVRDFIQGHYVGVQFLAEGLAL